MGYTTFASRRFARAALAAACVAFGLGETRAQNCNDFAMSEFTKVPLASNLGSPLKMAIAADGRILFIERSGTVRLLKPGGAPTQALKLTVPGGSNNEDGLLGIALDPKFATNSWVYLFYTPTSPMGYRISRFTLSGDVLETSSEKVLLTIPHPFTAYGALIIHGAGAMAFDPQGNLLVSTGDLSITNGGHPVPVNENMTNFDAQRTSANSNSLLGKILRITPKDDGTYSVPAGNLFASGTANTKPEVYVMGVRNPFTLTVDPKTGWAYSGEVGPDGTGGPIPSQDEVNQIKGAGNLGWPYLTGDNQAYSDMAGTKYNPAALVNNSKNNTGVKPLPAPTKSLFWMANSASWPITGITPKTGNRCIKVGAFYRYNAAGTNARRLPPFFDNGFFMANHNDGETLRFFKLDESGAIASVRAVFNNLARPMSFEVAPDGALYLMEWGGDNGHWFNNNNGVLSRLEYRGACSTTRVVAETPRGIREAEGMRAVQPGSRLLFPEGAARVDLYDLKGVKRWSAAAGGGAGPAHAVVPSRFESGLMYVKFSAR